MSKRVYVYTYVETCVSRSMHYDNDKVLVGTLCHFMHPMQLMVESSNATVREERLSDSHALYLVAVAMYVT